jgi:formylglycine-generating enzyme required for sulfatase activity
MVVRKMMDRDRNDRYKDPKELIHDLELVADNKLPENARGAPGQGAGAANLGLTQAGPPVTATSPAPGSETRSTGVVPVVVPRAGSNTGIIVGSVIGGLVVVVGIVLAVVLGGSSEEKKEPDPVAQPQVSSAEVFKILREIKNLEEKGDLAQAIKNAETAKSSFDGTPHAPKFATVLTDLRRKAELESMAKDHFDLIKRLSDSGNVEEALAQAQKAKDKYVDTALAKDLAGQLTALEKRAAETEAARRKLGVVMDIVLSLEKEGAHESALKRAKKDHEKLKDVQGGEKLTAAIERLQKVVDAKENDEAAREIALIREMAKSGSAGPALAKAIDAVDRYAGTRQANKFAALRDELRALIQKNQSTAAKTTRVNAALKEAAAAMDAKRYESAIAAYENALGIERSAKTEKLLAEARYANHMATAAAKERRRDLAAAIEEVKSARAFKDTAEAASKLKDLQRQITLDEKLAAASKLERAGRLAEAKDAYADALNIASGSEKRTVQASLDRVTTALADAQAIAVLSRVKALMKNEDFEGAVALASEGVNKYASKRAEFAALRDAAQSKVKRGEPTAEEKARHRALLKQAADASSARKYDDAVAAYEEALKIEPSGKTQDLLADARYQKHLSASMSLEEDGKFEAALKELDAATAVKSTPLATQRRKELERRVTLEKALEAGRALARDGKKDEAIAALTAAMKTATRRERRGIVNEIARIKSAETPRQADPVDGKTITSRIGMKLVLVPGGTYDVGQEDGQADEKPVRKVTLSPFYIGAFEVTNAEYRRFNPRHSPSQYSKGPNHPAIGITWEQANEFCVWLSRVERARFRLPTEAEWEVAARGAEGRLYPWGNDPSTTLLNWGNPQDKAASQADGHLYTAPVGSYKDAASPFGCYDMAGNVWEWCLDWYDAGAYGKGTSTDPRGPRGGREKVVRGGSWYHSAALARSANRHKLDPRSRQPSVGFRVVREVGK